RFERRPGTAPEQRPDAQRQAARQEVARRAVGTGKDRRRGGDPAAIRADAMPRADCGRAGEVPGIDGRGSARPADSAAGSAGGPMLGGADGAGVLVQPVEETAMSAEIPTEHPHIVRRPDTCGGSPLIRGTRITVRHIALLWNEGETVEEIVKSYTHLQPSWVHDAISYYLDHQQEIEQEIAANRIENVLAELGGVMDEKGVVRFPPGKGNDGE